LVKLAASISYPEVVSERELEKTTIPPVETIRTPSKLSVRVTPN
jgi:hypothetical protein